MMGRGILMWLNSDQYAYLVLKINCFIRLAYICKIVIVAIKFPFHHTPFSPSIEHLFGGVGLNAFVTLSPEINKNVGIDLFVN